MTRSHPILGLVMAGAIATTAVAGCNGQLTEVAPDPPPDCVPRDQQTAEEYWTPERMRNAQPRSMGVVEGQPRQRTPQGDPNINYCP